MSTRIGVAASLFLAAGAAVFAQETDGAWRDTLTVGTTVEAGRNLDLAAGNEDTSSRLSGDVAYGLTRSSGLNSFSIDLAGAVQSEGGVTSVSSTQAGLEYALSGARSSLTFSAGYARAPVTDIAITLDDAGDLAIYEGAGDRIVTTAAVGFAGGVDTPLRYSVNARLSDIGFVDTVSPSYYDTRTEAFSMGAEADLSALTVLSFDIQRTDYVADNAAALKRTTTDVGLGLAQRLDAVTDVSLSFGQSTINQSTFAVAEEISGLTYGFDLGRDHVLGRSVLGFQNSLTATGRRDTLYMQADFDRPRGDISTRIGATKGEAGTTDWVGVLSFGTELSRDAFDVDLVRNVVTDDENRDVLSTSVKMAYAHSLSEVARVGFDLTGAVRTAQGADQTRYDANLSYTRSLAYDANLTVGLSTGLSRKEGSSDARSQSLYIGLSREFTGFR